jgi:hypothetical protein
MSIERYQCTSLSGFIVAIQKYLVPKYFKYWEIYTYASSDFGVYLYADAPVFTLIEDEDAPANWSTNYNDYYTKDGDEYIKNNFDSEPEWEANVYYSRTAPTKKALRIGKLDGSDQYFRIQAYKDAATSEYWGSTQNSFPNNIVILSCDGGVLMRFSYNSAYVADLIVAKTNHGETACIFNGVTQTSTPTGTMYTTDVHAVAWGDYQSSEKKLTFTAQEQFQTQLVPFTTYAQYESISYTPTAFYCPKSSVYALRNHTVTYNGKYYVTNGYWMIADELPDIPSAESA